MNTYYVSKLRAKFELNDRYLDFLTEIILE